MAKTSRREPHTSRTDNGYHHLTLLARDAQGYQNLMKLASIAYLEGYNSGRASTRRCWRAHARGLACLSGCLAGESTSSSCAGDEARAERVAASSATSSGPEHFWLELQRNGIDIQDKANEALVRLQQPHRHPARRHQRHPLPAPRGLRGPGRAPVHQHRRQARRGEALQVRAPTRSTSRRARRWATIFRDLPETAARDAGRRRPGRRSRSSSATVPPAGLPRPTPTADARRSSSTGCCEEGLRAALRGAITRARPRAPRARERRVIVEMGFVSYFLIVWDLIRWAREHGIPVGPGPRLGGRARSSPTALGITRVDPLRYDLLFERFLNSARISMPDIDIDFCKEGRERVLEYTRERYGERARRADRHLRHDGLAHGRARRRPRRSTCRSRTSTASPRRSPPARARRRWPRPSRRTPTCSRSARASPSWRELFAALGQARGHGAPHLDARRRRRDRRPPDRRVRAALPRTATTSPRSGRRRSSRTSACSRWTSSGCAR